MCVCVGEMAQRTKLCYGGFATRVWAPRTHIKPCIIPVLGKWRRDSWLASQADSGINGWVRDPVLVNKEDGRCQSPLVPTHASMHKEHASTKQSRDHLGSVMKAGPLTHSQHSTPRNYSAEQKKPDPNRVHTCVMPSAYKCTQITNPNVREMAVYVCACACVCKHTHACVTENQTHILRQALCYRDIPQSSFHPSSETGSY